MAKELNPELFIQQVPLDVLEDLADTLAREGGHPLLDGECASAAELMERLRANPALHARFEASLPQIHELADGDGLSEIRRVCAGRGLSVDGEITTRVTSEHIATWLRAAHPDAFREAYRYRTADEWSNRQRLRRAAEIEIEPDVSEPALAEFNGRISKALYGHGMGRFCKFPTVLVRDARTYIFLYPSDLPSADLRYGVDGVERLEPEFPSRELVFSYDPHRGAVEVLADADKKVRTKLSEIFAKVVLGVSLPPMPRRERQHTLRPLLSPGVAFPTQPDDGVSSVLLKAIKVRLPGDQAPALSVEVSAMETGAKPLHVALLSALEGFGLSLDGVQPYHATFRVTFEPTLDHPRGRSLGFTISEHHCSLGTKKHHQSLVHLIDDWRLRIA